MGTRADFYIGKDDKAEWLGSIAWDGYPDGDPEKLFKAANEDEFRRSFKALMGKRDDFTSPEMGWPWPWDDSRTTDYAYAFADGKVWMSCFGKVYIPATATQPSEEHEDWMNGPKEQVFPLRGGRPGAEHSAPLGSKRSGIMVFGLK